MKRFFLVLLFTFTQCVVSKAQKVHFTDSTNQWSELQPIYDAPNPWILDYSSFSYVGDTTIDSFGYRNFGFGWVREDSIAKKVYLREQDSDILLMDYNLKVGDTFVGPYYQFPVLKVDSTQINSVWHKVWYFPFYTGGWYYDIDTIYVVEGVGCLETPTFMVADYSGCIECGQPFIYCFSNNNTTPPLLPQTGWLDNTTSCATYPHLSVNTLHRSGAWINIYPNPATHDINITSSENITEISIANVLGQTVFEQKCHGKEFSVNVTSWTVGTYYLKINGSTIRKFVKI
ncbi:MAG: T9SS type A sorting domain-containing protein [Bacteroidetes bacterium]|nr:T9SS type A sorting domain-containing protein [Bacteroidota bacterium]